MGLLLEAVDVAGPLRWRWLLSDEETGNPVADHPVNLDPAADEVARFRDLYGYVRSYAAPDRRTEDGARFVSAAGAWAGRELLGESVGAAIAAEAPVTVRVKVPVALDPVLLWPLELAHAAGRPLAAQGDVTLVYDIAPDAPVRRKDEIGVMLRMLAVFSQPTKTSVLALRRERYALSQLIRRISGRERAMVQLQVVQYGVTRERLERIADSDDGWDVLHLSGHGAGGVFTLEKDDGSPDLVSTGDLMGLLRPVRRRVKLAVVSACESAADTTAQALRLIGLTEQAEAVEAESGEWIATQVPGLARALVRELDCAVVAMRYPVTDEFAIAFGDVFYEHLLSRRQPVDVAVARALAKATGPVPSAARPAVSLATPGVFGARAAGLRLAVPRGRPVMDPADKKMAYSIRPMVPVSPNGSSGGPRRWRRRARRWRPAAGGRRCCCTGWRGRGRRRARWNSRTGTRTGSRLPPSGRRRPAKRSGRAPSPILRSGWTSSLATTGSR
jgi:CHAT domain